MGPTLQPQPQPQAKDNILQNPIVQQLIQQYGKQLLVAAVTAILGLFKKKPKYAEPLTPQSAPLPVNTPFPVPAPTPNVPTAGVPSRQIANVTLRILQAERPDMSTPDRLQDPGNLYNDVAGMVARKENFNYGSRVWVTLSAFDQNGDELLGDAIIKNDLEYRTEYEIYKNGQLVSYMRGMGDDNPNGEGEPKPWAQQSEDVTIGWRPWHDSKGFTFVGRFGAEAVYTVRGKVNGIPARQEVELHFS